MKKTIEKEENLHLKQGEVIDLIVEDGKACGVVLKTGLCYRAKAGSSFVTELSLPERYS